MKLSPRVSRFSRHWTDQEIDDVVSIRSMPVDLSGSDVVRNSELLDKAMRRIFLPDVQVRKLLRVFVSLACGHAEKHFANDCDYRTGLNSKFPWGQTTVPAICFTGLAGSGKSALLAALGRMLGANGVTSIDGYKNLPLVSHWPVTLRDGIGLNGLLRDFLNPVLALQAPVFTSDRKVPVAAKDVKIPVLLDRARRIAWRDAVCLLTVDEFQFISFGDTANAKATNVLLQLLGIGPLLVYCPNYSLVHKLMKRASEARQRLLSRPLVIHPLLASDSDWIAYLVELQLVAPPILDFNPEADAAQIHLYTFGLKRLVVELIVVAYKISMNQTKSRIVGANELRLAYQSIDYSVNREDVEILHRQSIQLTMLRDDLWCPFSSTEFKQNVKEASIAISGFERRTEDALLDAALLPNEAIANAMLIPSVSLANSSAKIIRFRGKKASKDDLLAGAGILASLD